jgi:adenosylhomocysteine nucleosidase
MVNKGRYGVIAAMKIEAEHIVAAMEDVRTETVGGIEFTLGTIRRGQDEWTGDQGSEAEVICAVCGVGKVNAAMCAETMILHFAPARIINTGVAGSLSTELGGGDVVIASDVVQHDFDTSALGDPPGLIPGLDTVKMHCSDRLRMSELRNAAEAVLEGTGAKILHGVIASGDQFVADPETKKRIVERVGAAACEMEGGAIGQVCAANGVPFAVVRTMSDSADGGAVEDYPAFARKAAVVAANIVSRAVSVVC